MSRIDEITRFYKPGHDATIDERLLAAAKSDNEELLDEVFSKPGTFNINHQDGFVHCCN